MAPLNVPKSCMLCRFTHSAISLKVDGRSIAVLVSGLNSALTRICNTRLQHVFCGLVEKRHHPTRLIDLQLGRATVLAMGAYRAAMLICEQCNSLIPLIINDRMLTDFGTSRLSCTPRLIDSIHQFALNDAGYNVGARCGATQYGADEIVIG